VNAPIVILAALAASIVAGGVLVGGIALVVRLRALDAASRHQLWFATLVAIALLPVVGIAASLAHATRTAPPVTWNAPKTAPQQQRAASSTQAPRSAAVRVAAPANETSGSMGSSLPWSVAGVPASVAGFVLVALGGVAVLGLLGLGLSILRIGSVKKRSSPLDEELANDLPWLTQTRQGRETYLRLSYEIEAPVAIGFGRPVILIPTDLATRSGLDGIEDLVIHEHEHLRRFDDYTNLVQRAIERIFWFNPFVWIVGRRIALQREMAADDAVVRRGEDRTRYAETLWRLAKEMRMPAHTVVAPGALFSRKQISLRIEALLSPAHASLRKWGPASVAAAVGIALFSCALVALAAPPLQLPGTPGQNDLAKMAAPPVAPAAPAVSAAPAAVAHTLDTTTAGLDRLAERIGSRLNELRASVDASQHLPHDVSSGIRHETALLQDKLATMQHMAQDQAPDKTRDRIAQLQSTARSIDDDVNARETVTSGGASAHTGAVHVDVPAIHVNVPGTRVDVPAIHVEVPGVNVEVPPVHVDVPPVNVDVPRLSERSRTVAMNGDSPSPTTPITRELLARCTGCSLAGRDLRNMDLHGIKLVGSDLRNADLRGANLRDADLTGTDMRDAKFDGADLRNAKLNGADMGGATFAGALMDGIEMNGISLRHTKLDHAGLRDLLAHGCTGCDLSQMDLRGIDLHGIRLEGTDFAHSDLSGANLRDARLTGVSFDHANLSHADLRGAELVGCSLQHTTLDGVMIDGVKLTGTSLDL
jgi:uncharacterized protein YjbI with pentapeptide repeats/beta-lactamase regulating signal transducer with metallopeptidase domain